MSEGQSIIQHLRRFDAYPKTLDDFRIKTLFGGTLTIVSALVMSILFISELVSYLELDTKSELLVDTARDKKISIYFDIIFNHMPCNTLTVDAMDVSGVQQFDVMHNVFKRRLDSNGIKIDTEPQKQEINTAKVNNKTAMDPNRCESCYGAESEALKCCNTCDDVKQAYRSRSWALVNLHLIVQCAREGITDGISAKRATLPKEGCNFYGHIEVNKVAGNIHFAPGETFPGSHSHIHDMSNMPSGSINATHRIKYLSFGKYFPGMVNPLDSVLSIDQSNMGMFQYYLKIVPTRYRRLGVPLEDGGLITNQYSVTRQVKTVTGFLGEQGLPGAFFLYEFSPMLVQYSETKRSFTHFLTNLCAIIGGVFTVAGLIDAFFYHSSRLIEKKIELGKIS